MEKFKPFIIPCLLYTSGGRELMTNGFDEMILNMTDTTPEPEDYTGEDGLLYLSLIHISIALSMKTGKLTAQALQAALKKYLQHRAKGPKLHHGDVYKRQGHSTGGPSRAGSPADLPQSSSAGLPNHPTDC